jgi:hypothetical protein
MDREYLLTRLRYDPETGKLWWRDCPSNPPKWNGRWAGREAFTAVSNGYYVGRIDDRKYYAHRVAFMLHYGAWPAQVDHINHDRLDNRASNLRAADARVNSSNLPLSPRNTSGAVGVQQRPSGRWVARIHTQGRQINLGTFDTMEAAISARKSADTEYGFHPNHGKTKEH